MDLDPLASSRLPRLACVDSLEASVISRLPFSPSSAGIRMNNLLTVSNT